MERQEKPDEPLLRKMPYMGDGRQSVPPVPSVTQNLELHKKSSNNDNQLVKVSYFLNQMSAPTF